MIQMLQKNLRIKSVASKQLISIKFDKILLRLADLLDMSSYRVSKPILYHNVEQMSEESAFHWISHLLTKGYSLRTEYEITDNAHVLAPKNIIEKLVLEIPVNISQMSALTCGRTCKKVGIDRNRLSQQGIVLVCGQECKDNGNQERNCNFLCKWFCVKNENLIKELAALKEYLNRNKNNYFKSAIEIRIKCNDRNDYPALVVELKWNKSAKSALQQIKDRKYPASIEQYTGDILLVGINYDKKTKKHECVIEQYEK